VTNSSADNTFGWRFVAPLALGSTLNAVNSSMIATALVPISRDLGVEPAQTIVLVACLYVACAVAQPTMGRLGDWLGPRRVFVWGTATAGLGALFGAAANSLWVLVVARVLIGVGTSAAYPNAMLLIRRRHEDFPHASPGTALGLLTFSAQVTTAAGLPIGGLLVQHFGWRSIFIANLPGVTVCIWMTLRGIPRDAPTLRQTTTRRALWNLDPIGMSLFTVAVSLLFAVAQQLPGAPIVLLTALACCVVAFTAWELRSPRPFMHLRAMAKNRRLSATFIRTCLCYLGSYAVFYGLTLWLQEDHGVTEATAGLLILPTTLIAAPVSFLVARSRRVWAPLVFCAASLGVVGVWLTLVDPSTPLVVFVVVAAIAGVAMGTMSAGNQNALYREAALSSIGTAAGTFRTFLYLGAIVASGVTNVAYVDGVTTDGLATIGLTVLGCGCAVLVMVGFGARRRT
jgi:MFS family permease